MNKPIIVIGMHRSGTSLVSRILDRVGIFMGKKLDGNYEALFFQDLNRWILAQLGCRWDNPPKEYHLLNKDVCNLIVEHLEQSLNSPNIIKYVGVKNYVLYKNRFLNKSFLWGWKDPRNTYTLPLWLKIFPNAKIIYVERHGVDVANSLRKRSQFRTQSAIRKYEKYSWMYLLNIKKTEFSYSSSVRCSNLEGGFTLWENYVKAGRENINKLNNDQVFKIKYEELLTNHWEVLKNMGEFIGHNTSETIQDIDIDIKKDRGYAYKNNPELNAFADKVSDRLMEYGE